MKNLYWKKYHDLVRPVNPSKYVKYQNLTPPPRIIPSKPCSSHYILEKVKNGQTAWEDSKDLSTRLREQRNSTCSLLFSSSHDCRSSHLRTPSTIHHNYPPPLSTVPNNATAVYTTFPSSKSPPFHIG